MSLVIINTEESYPVGSTQSGPISDREGVFHEVTVLVVREASAEEYLAYVKDQGGFIVEPLAPYFYAVAMD